MSAEMQAAIDRADGSRSGLNLPEADWTEQAGQEVLEKLLFIGDADTCKNERFMRENNITHVVNATQDPKLGGERNWFNLESQTLKLKYMRVDVQDNEDYSIRPFFEPANGFIEGARKSGGAVLVHCRQGRSRSSSIILAYMMMHRQMDYDEALAQVQAKRPIANPISKFEQELRAYDKEKCEPLRKLLRELEESGHDAGKHSKRKEPSGPVAGPEMPKKQATEKAASNGAPAVEVEKVKCCACNEEKLADAFSKSQMRKAEGERKCSQCVSGAATAAGTGPSLPFANDGSFLDKFKAMQK